MDTDGVLRKDTSPYKYIRYRERNEDLSALIDRIYDLAKAESTYGTFGLTVKDLFEMDYTSFVDLEQRVRKIDKAKSDIVNEELKDIKNFKKEK